MSKTLLITGGGRGIGAATALAAARAGWDVAINYLEKSARADQIVAEVTKLGRKAKAYPADIADERAVIELFAAVDRDFGALHGLVNSAGIIGPHGRIDTVDAAGSTGLFAINITGTLICCREAIKRMSTKHGGKGGAIVNLSSAASRIGGAGETVPYAASKGAIDSLTFGLAQEVAGRRHSRQRGQPRRHRHRDPARRPRRARRPQPADETRRQRRGSRERDPLSALRRSLLHRRHRARRHRRRTASVHDGTRRKAILTVSPSM